MSTIASEKSGGDFEPVAAGTYAAVCDQVVDLGIQPGGQFDPKRKVYIRFQVPSERTTWKDQQGTEHSGPMVIGRTFTISLGEKSNLRPFLESWRGRAFTRDELRGFDIKNVLGAPCLISVIHEQAKDGRTFAKVAAAMSLPAGVPRPIAEGPLLHYDHDKPNPDTFAKLSKRVQERIKGGLAGDTAISIMAGKVPVDDFDDKVPF